MTGCPLLKQCHSIVSQVSQLVHEPGLSIVFSAAREDLAASVSDQQRVLELSGPFPVLRHSCPVVRPRLIPPRTWQWLKDISYRSKSVYFRFDFSPKQGEFQYSIFYQLPLHQQPRETCRGKFLNFRAQRPDDVPGGGSVPRRRRQHDSLGSQRNSKYMLGLILTGRATRRARKLERFSFDVACMQCEHFHWRQQVPFALSVASGVLCELGLTFRNHRFYRETVSRFHDSHCFIFCGQNKRTEIRHVCNLVQSFIRPGKRKRISLMLRTVFTHLHNGAHLELCGTTWKQKGAHFSQHIR